MSFEDLKKNISNEKKIARELNSLMNYFENTKEREERIMIGSQIDSLVIALRKNNLEALEQLKKINIEKPLISKIEETKKQVQEPLKKIKILKDEKIKENLSELEERTLKRLGKEEARIQIKKEKKPGKYATISSRFFSNLSKKLIKKKMFETLERDLIKANLQFVSSGYVSIILSTTLLSLIFSIFIFLFFLFFDFGATLPIVTRATEEITTRFAKTFWIPFVIPIGTFLFMYFYPSLEKKAAETKINYELPFATINMAAIAGSMIDPTKIFSIIISTKEYPALEKEFTKLMNEINIYGYDLITALKSTAYNNPSKRLSDLLNGLSTTISSGGNLPEFFDKRAQTLLFEHKIEKEKNTKAAETFMDIYISVVIAAPMILMLLLMMIKIGGLGISLSTSAITLIMTLGVTLVNIIFISFLHLKQSGE